jgi:hypothetical protein
MSDEIKGDVINRELPAAGLHKAYICIVAVLGRLNETYEGHPKKVKKVLISFEITDQTHVFDSKKGPERFIHHQKFTLAMGSQANLRKLLDGFKGEAMTDKEAEDFNIANLAGCCLNINLIKKMSKQGRPRMEVAGLIAMSDADCAAMPAMIHEELVFTLREPFNTEVFNKLPEWVQTDIKSSEEYIERYGVAAAGVNQPANATPPPAPGEKKKNVPF